MLAGTSSKTPSCAKAVMSATTDVSRRMSYVTANAMSERQSARARMVTAGHDNLTRIFGDINDARIVEILALKPTLPELEEAAVWIAGNGDALAKTGHPLSPVVEMMSAGEEEEQRC